MTLTIFETGQSQLTICETISHDNIATIR